MKKFLKITAVLILSLLIFFVGTFKYRQYKANQISIPKNATSLIKISIDEIYKSLAKNMIANPGYYFKSDLKKDTTSKLKDFDHGLSISAAIYLYSIDNQPNTALFTKLEIDDVKKFENFLKNVLQFNIVKQKDGINLAKSKLGNVALLYNKDYAAVAISGMAANFNSTLNDILDQKNNTSISDSQFSNLTKSTQHIAFSNCSNEAYINFESGTVKFDYTFLSKAIIPSKKPSHKKFDNASTISFWMNADLKALHSNPLKIKNTQLHQDSVLKYYRGYLDFEWLNTLNQTDSIITYEYNDDFEKVEKVTLQKINIPNITVGIDADAKGLQNYLDQKDVINLNSGTINKSFFPLYKVYVSKMNKQFLLSTGKNPKTKSAMIQSDDFLGLNINFLKLRREANFPLITRYFQNLQKLEIKGKAISNRKVNITGDLSFKNDKINSLYQILKML
ncbi:MULTISPECIES: DUF4836 family protein [Pedobacter]|uniref:DUF4836 family protein n=1 Tax=Pedobacter TaxID=84567 RepID=UPI001E45CF1B|nr:MULTISPECIES: DUF4836 family protein [Pedobacter]